MNRTFESTSKYRARIVNIDEVADRSDAARNTGLVLDDSMRRAPHGGSAPGAHIAIVPEADDRSFMRRVHAAAAVLVSVITVVISAGPALADPATSFPDCPVLSENNSTGPCVQRLQNDLNAVNSGYGLTPDGTFGADTRIAVLDFQGRNHLGADGIVGAETADLLAAQAQAMGSVATPQPGPSRTPQERCASLGMIVYGTDRCIRDGVVASGLSATECLKEQVGAKAYEEAVKQGFGDEAARALASEAAGKALEKLSLIKSVWDGAKCMFFDNDPEALKAYESVPMP
jgi:peptidoglycan hydrolase-like protein with peptidoglycan-binding domain